MTRHVSHILRKREQHKSYEVSQYDFGMPEFTLNAPADVPILFESRTDCMACTACMSLCPMGAISMISDEEGFLYPKIEASKCVRCRKCVSVCPIKMRDRENEE